MNRILLTTATVALALAATACAAQPSSTGVASVKAASAAPTATASPTGSVDPQEQGRKFAACMREHGVDMPDPDPDGGGGIQAMSAMKGDKDAIMKALESCRSVAPVRDRKALKPEDAEQLRQFAACMRKNGVDMPDPDASGAIAKSTARNFKPDDPAFKKAYEACRGTFPKLGQAK